MRPRLVPDNTIQRIKRGEKEAFESIFREYYTPLWNLAAGILKDDVLAEEQVQEVFIKFWEKRDDHQPTLKIFPYLVTSVRNKCYNYIKRQAVEQKYINHTQKLYQDQILNYQYEDLSEDLIRKMETVIASLPEKCKQVFQLSRFENMSHKQISDKLDISTKTVENHITKAMKVLKDSLLEVLIICILIIGDF
ncbi:RNA polymerase sigma-70 factor [Fulvivirga sediminis]|uniref:RNA polymerase sigma-70 factor n=1 Tax=Fulvivirga sediminis TaxID=2803949 RepID=A0A937K0H2_9BACT|nr:RNA polymerase sigma-70 factor [Fulvivirga sediminis]MBL3656305.1 RNA polymerase sigma-70 factor [Fulvivirga sediminis]